MSLFHSSCSHRRISPDNNLQQKSLYVLLSCIVSLKQKWTFKILAANWGPVLLFCCSDVSQTYGLFSPTCKPFLVGLKSKFRGSPAKIYHLLCQHLSLVREILLFSAFTTVMPTRFKKTMQVMSNLPHRPLNKAGLHWPSVLATEALVDGQQGTSWDWFVQLNRIVLISLENIC